MAGMAVERTLASSRLSPRPRPSFQGRFNKKRVAVESPPTLPQPLAARAQRLTLDEGTPDIGIISTGYLRQHTGRREARGKGQEGPTSLLG